MTHQEFILGIIILGVTIVGTLYGMLNPIRQDIRDIRDKLDQAGKERQDLSLTIQRVQDDLADRRWRRD